jgi:ferredoxin--NADP+ reductase
VGVRGKVSGVLDLLDGEGKKVDMYYFIGCTFMMMNGAAKTPDHAKTFVALTALMVDGTGMCGCCRVSVGGKTRFVCVDGPEFDGKEVDWDLLAQRNALYNREEMMAYHQHTCKVTKGVGE